MVDNGLIKLIHFLAYGLGINPQVTTHKTFTVISAEDLDFYIQYSAAAEYFNSDIQPQKKTIHISSEQLSRNFPKIFNRIKVQAGMGHRIYARSTVSARVDKKTTLEFLSEHHLQVPLPGKYRYGLYYNGELVSIAVFSGGRKMKDMPEDYRSFELLRFCHKADTLVVGGISKLLKKFISEFHPSDIMTYVDLDWTQDSSLKSIGFRPESTSAARQYWISNEQQIPINSDAELQLAKKNHSGGYLHYNLGSIKMRLTL